jgi:hypothetical protein
MFHVVTAQSCTAVDNFDRAETEKHPLDILVYAAKHGYLELLDKAATMVIGQSLDSAIDRMPPAIAIAWVRKSALRDVTRFLDYS